MNKVKQIREKKMNIMQQEKRDKMKEIKQEKEQRKFFQWMKLKTPFKQIEQKFKTSLIEQINDEVSKIEIYEHLKRIEARNKKMKNLTSRERFQMERNDQISLKSIIKPYTESMQECNYLAYAKNPIQFSDTKRTQNVKKRSQSANHERGKNPKVKWSKEREEFFKKYRVDT